MATSSVKSSVTFVTTDYIFAAFLATHYNSHYFVSLTAGAMAMFMIVILFFTLSRVEDSLWDVVPTKPAK